MEDQPNNIIVISKILEERKLKREREFLALKSSYEAITICLRYLDMSDLRQLNNLKSLMKKTLKTLKTND